MVYRAVPEIPLYLPVLPISVCTRGGRIERRNILSPSMSVSAQAPTPPTLPPMACGNRGSAPTCCQRALKVAQATTTTALPRRRSERRAHHRCADRSNRLPRRLCVDKGPTAAHNEEAASKAPAAVKALIASLLKH